MNNLSSYSGLVDAKIRASDKDLPVKQKSIKSVDGELYWKDVRHFNLLTKSTLEAKSTECTT